ncbi:MAG: hypothetical protein K6C69_00365 [Lachnospiraceae bacterium]|nr:hypothetical protein [Lachnospiraceae bacterium]
MKGWKEWPLYQKSGVKGVVFLIICWFLGIGLMALLALAINSDGSLTRFPIASFLVMFCGYCQVILLGPIHMRNAFGLSMSVGNTRKHFFLQSLQYYSLYLIGCWGLSVLGYYVEGWYQEFFFGQIPVDADSFTISTTACSSLGVFFLSLGIWMFVGAIIIGHIKAFSFIMVIGSMLIGITPSLLKNFGVLPMEWGENMPGLNFFGGLDSIPMVGLCIIICGVLLGCSYGLLRKESVSLL